MTEHIGFIGTGAMGLPMASSLLQAGFSVAVYNRTAERAEPLRAAGAEIVSAPARVARPGGIVITMLADDVALEQIALSDDLLAKRLGDGGIHISMSTVSPMIARRVAERHAQFGVSYVAAPVFGRPEAAAARKLWIPCSGPEKAKARVRPILEVMGQGVSDFGEEPGAANVVKLAGNFLIGSALEALSETSALSRKNGIEPGRLFEFLTQTLFNCPIYQGYSKSIVEGRFDPPSFRLRLGLKDMNLVLRVAEASQTPMPLASLVRDRAVASMAKGRAEQDWISLSLEAAEDAGITL